MKARWTAGLPGLLLLAVARWPLTVAPAGDSAGAHAASEPLALALAPLGPVRALVSSALWVHLLDSQTGADSERVNAIAHALLEVHPDLEVVREYLANQLIVTEARRAPDRPRHDALVAAGLRLFEEGLQDDGSPRLRSGLAWTLAAQARLDARFAAAAQRFFGETAENVAIELLEGSAEPFDARTRGQLLVERGLAALIGTGDERSARRDLAEAERALVPLAARDPVFVEDALQPLRAALAQPPGEPRALRPPLPEPEPELEDGEP